MKRKIVSVILGLLMIFTLTACSGIDTGESTSDLSTSEKSTEELTGEWIVNENSILPEDNKEAREAFNKANNKDGYMNIPIAVLGSQTVSGTNYSYLCKGRISVPDSEWGYFIANVYEDLDGNCEITGTKGLPFDINDGWKSNQNDYELEKNADVERIFDEAIKNSTDKEYEPIAYIAQQPYYDKSYVVFTRTKKLSSDDNKRFNILIFTEGADGKIELKRVNNVDIGVGK
mgnify:FL=1